MVAIKVLVRRDILTSLTAPWRDGIRTPVMTASENFLKSRHAVGLWLLATELVILAMVTIGGLPRLAGSRLSITEGQPIRGANPPLNDAQWADAFARYQRIPQYIVENRGM